MNSSYVFLLKNTSHHMQKFNMITIRFLWKFTIPTCVHCTTTFYIKHNNLTLNSASNCSKNWIPFVYNLLFSKPLKHFLSGIIYNLMPILQLYKHFKDLINILSIWKVKKRLSCSITESTSADFVKTSVNLTTHKQKWWARTYLSFSCYHYPGFSENTSFFPPLRYFTKK